MRRGITLLLAIFLSMPLSFVSAEEETIGWTLTAGGPLDDMLANHVITDSGLLVAAGSFSGAIEFDLDGLSADDNGNRDIFVAQASSVGVWTNVTGIGSGGDDVVVDLALHSSGDIIILGYFCRESARSICNLTFTDDIVLEKPSPSDDSGGIFVARAAITENSLQWLWAIQATDTVGIEPKTLSIATNGTIAFSFGNIGMMEINDTEYPSGGALSVMQIDENGEIITLTSFDSGSGLLEFNNHCFGPNGNLYVISSFIDSIIAGNNEGIESNGNSDIMLAKVDSNGAILWIDTFGGSGYEWPSACTVDSAGQLYVIGQFEEQVVIQNNTLDSNGYADIFVLRFSADGVLEGSLTAGGNGPDNVADIEINSQGSIFINGGYGLNFTIGNDELEDADGNKYLMDGFIAQISAEDEWLWAIAVTSSNDIQPIGIDSTATSSPVASFVFKGKAEINGNLNSSVGGADFAIWQYGSDFDGDGFVDGEDNCYKDVNPEQKDYDGDDKGDYCDLDDDNDGVLDGDDACDPDSNIDSDTGWISNENTDHDGDGCRDAGMEDSDDDNDGIDDVEDNCPEGSVNWVSNIEEDQDEDGCSDQDTDEDGIVDQSDTCPDVANPLQDDLDNDGSGDACDDDLDGDGIGNSVDKCPADSPMWQSNGDTDHDSDGCKNEVDTDDDDDGYLDNSDSCPSGLMGWNASNDRDEDGCSDAEDDDDDADGYLDESDSCPQSIVIGLAGYLQDYDEDGCLDPVEDDDDDGDGINDANDECKFTFPQLAVNPNGCSNSELDDDGDDVTNVDDLCPNSEEGALVSANGCITKIIQDDVEAQGSSDGLATSTILFLIAGLIFIVALVIVMRKEDEEYIQDEIEKSTLEPVALDIQQTEESVSEHKSEGDSETNSETVIEQEVTESLETQE
jgi:hypothetical protein